jgi:hypothetical protein
MRQIFKTSRWLVLGAAVLGLGILSSVSFSQAQQAPAAQGAPAKQIGTVKGIAGNTLTLKSDSGPEFKTPRASCASPPEKPA